MCVVSEVRSDCERHLLVSNLFVTIHQMVTWCHLSLSLISQASPHVPSHPFLSIFTKVKSLRDPGHMYSEPFFVNTTFYQIDLKKWRNGPEIWLVCGGRRRREDPLLEADPIKYVAVIESEWIEEEEEGTVALADTWSSVNNHYQSSFILSCSGSCHLEGEINLWLFLFTIIEIISQLC